MNNKYLIGIIILLAIALGLSYFKKPLMSKNSNEIKKEDLLSDCLNKINPNDPLGVMSSSTPKQEQEKKDCIEKYDANNNPLGI